MKDMSYFDRLDENGKKTFAGAFRPYYAETGDFDAAYEKGKAAAGGAQNEASRAGASAEKQKQPGVMETALGYISNAINTAGNFMYDPMVTINSGKKSGWAQEKQSLAQTAGYQTPKTGGMSYFNSLTDDDRHVYADAYREATGLPGQAGRGGTHAAGMEAGKAAVEQPRTAAAAEAQARIDALDKLTAEQEQAEAKRDNMQAYAGSLLTGRGGIPGWLDPTSWNRGSSLTVAEAVGGKTVAQKNAEERDAMANAQGRTRTERELLRQKALEDAKKTEEQERRVAAMDAAADAGLAYVPEERTAAVTEGKTLTGKPQKGASGTAFTLYDADETSRTEGTAANAEGGRQSRTSEAGAKRGTFYTVAKGMVENGQGEDVDSFMERLPALIQTVSKYGITAIHKDYKRLYLALQGEGGSFFVPDGEDMQGGSEGAKQYAQREIDAARADYQAAQDKQAQAEADRADRKQQIIEANEELRKTDPEQAALNDKYIEGGVLDKVELTGGFVTTSALTGITRADEGIISGLSNLAAGAVDFFTKPWGIWGEGYTQPKWAENAAAYLRNNPLKQSYEELNAAYEEEFARQKKAFQQSVMNDLVDAGWSETAANAAANVAGTALGDAVAEGARQLPNFIISSMSGGATALTNMQNITKAAGAGQKALGTASVLEAAATGARYNGSAEYLARGVKNAMSNPTFPLVFLHSYNSTYKGAVANGKSTEEAMALGLANGYFNALIEYGGGETASGIEGIMTKGDGTAFADRILSIGEEVSEELGQDIVEKSLENIVGGLFRGQEGANENALFATGRTAEDGREAVISIAGMWDTTWQTAVTTVMLNIEQAAAQKGMNLSAKAVEAAMRSAKAKGFESSVQAVLNGDATKEQQKTAAAFVRMLENGVTEAQTEARHDTFEAAARGETQEAAETDAVLEAALEKAAADEAVGNADLPWQADRLSGEQNQADAAENAAETAQALEDAETAQAENEMAADALRQEADAARQEAAPETQTAEQGGQEKAKTEEQAARAELENIQAEAREAEAAATEAQERFWEAPTEANREAAESAGRVWQDAVERAEQAVKTYAQSVEKLRQAVQGAGQKQAAAAETQRTKENAAETQQSRTDATETEMATASESRVGVPLTERAADETAGAEHRREADMQRWQDASAETIYEEAGREQETLNDLLSSMHDALGLRTPYEAVTQKSVQSMKNKVARKRAEGRDYSLLDMKDHARSRLVLDSFEQTQDVLDTLAQNGIACQVEAVGPTNFGYRGLHITWRTKNGLGVEVQLTTPEAWKTKKISDKIYEKWRNVDLKRLTEKEELNYYKDIARSLQMWNQLGLPDFSMYERASSSDTSLEFISSAPKSERASLPQRPSENSSMPDSLTRINRPDSVTDSNTLLMETPPISDNSIINQDVENIKNSEEKDQKGQEKNGQVKTLADVNRLSDAEKARRTAALAKELNVKTTAESKSGAGLVIRQAARDLSEMQKTNLRLVDMAARMQGIRVVLDDEVGGGRANAKYDSATNVIYLDTGAQGLYTKYLSHELVHYIRRNNAQGYKALENLFDLYAEQTEGYDAEARIEERIEEYARQGVKLDRAAAREELVADSVLDMIANERTVMDVYAMNRTLFGQIKDWVEKQLSQIRRMLDRAKADSPEARMMMQTRGHYETVQALFDRVLREASTNARLLKQLNRFSNVDGIAGEYMQSIRSAMRNEERAESLHTLARSILTKSGDEATQENVRTLMDIAERAERGEIRGVYGNMVKEAGLKGWDSGNTELNKAFVTLLTQTGAFEDNGIRYDIKKDVHGKEYVFVSEDILKGVPKKQWIATVMQNMERKFKDGVPVRNDQIDIDKKTRKEVTRSKYTQLLKEMRNDMYADKMRATNNADEIIWASTDYVGEAPKHMRSDDMVEFARGKVRIKVGNHDYNAQVIVGTRENGSMRLYDIVAMQPTTIQEKQNEGEHHPGLQAESLITGRIDALRENNVPQVGEKVKDISENDKNKFSMRSKADNQTETEAFKRWFGDSKVVDEDGKPLKVYHGTDADFNVFDMTRGRANMDIQGAFFSPYEMDAEGYGGNVRAFYLRIKNPADEGTAYKALNRFKGQNGAGVKARQYLQSLGYDGVYNGYDEYIAFEPTQIKSATDNVGTFDADDPDIRYSLKDGGEIEDAYVRYAMKDGDGRSETDIRQEYQEDISPLVEADGEDADVWTRHEEGKKRNVRAAALDGLQAQLVRQQEAGKGTRYSGNISDVSKKLLTDTGSGITKARANKILRAAYAQLDEALNNKATGAAMQDAVDTAFEIARQAAEESLQNQKAQYLEESEEDMFFRQLRYTPFSLSKDQMSEVRNAYESVAAYRQAAFGNLKVVSKETSRNQLEDMWEEIAAKTGLDEDTNAVDMPLVLLEYIEYRRNEKKKVTALTDEENAVADIVAQDALLAYYASRKSVNVVKTAKQLAWENKRLKDKIETLKQRSETALREERKRIDAEIARQTAELNRALAEEKAFSRFEARRVDELAVKIAEEKKKHEAELKGLKKELEKERRKREAEKQKRDAAKREKEQKSADLIREEYEGTLAPMLQGEQEATGLPGQAGKWTKAMQQAANERRRDNALTMTAIQDLEEAQERSVRQAAEAMGSKKSGEHVSRYTGSVKELAKNIRSYVGGDGMTEKQLAGKIKGVFEGLEESKRTGETKTALHEAMRTLSDVMRDQMADRGTGDDATYQRVKDTLRGERFYLTKEQEESVRDIFKSTAVFRKQGYGIISMGTEKTAKQTLSDVWRKLTAIDAAAFPADTKASDMPDTLMSYLNEKRGQGVELSGEYMTLANSAALAALTDYYQNQSAEYSGKDADRLAKQVERLQAAMQRNADRYKQAKRKEKAEREKSKNRQGIRKLAKELRTAIASPTESRYVPVDYMRTILDVTEALTNGDRQVLDRALTRWRNANTQMQNDSDYFIKQAFDPDMEKRIAEMVELTERKSVEQLDGEETRFVYETLRGAATALQNARKIIGQGKKKDAFEAASEGNRQLRRTKGSDAHGLIRQFGNRYLTMMQSGVRFFRLISGYAKDGVLEERAQALNDGQHRANKIRMEGSGIFADLITGKDRQTFRGRQTDRALQKELASFTGRNAEWVDTGVSVAVERNGQITKEKLTMTRAMRASLYMHSKNEQNMNHVVKGGITIPDARLYREGRLQEAYARGVTVRLTEKEVAAVIRGMTEYEKAWCEGWTRLEEKLSKEINDTSLKLNGFKKAVVDNYFPIRTDRNFVRSNFETVVNDASLEGMGMLKNRVNGSNPILLEDITKVAERQIDNTAKYAGLAIPVRDFMTVYNATMPGYAGSMKQEVAQKWGVVGQRYIENLMADLQGARQGENSFLDRARGKFAQAKLNMNISTAFKQVSGAMVITPYTGWAAMTRAMGTGSKTMKSTDFIAQWTATNWARGDNRAKTEIGGVARDFTLFDRAPRLDWLNRMDEWTMRKIWTACEYAVSEQDGQDGSTYRQGTQAYTDYYTRVAALFDKCVDDTQPSSGVMQRTDIARDTNQLIKSLTMFMGQGLQNFGVLTDTYGEMRARAADVKANASAENQAAFRAAKTRFASAVASQLTAAAVTAVSGLLARMLLARMNPYRDDKEEITGESLMEGIIDDTLSNIAGTVIGGQEAYNLLTAVMQGKTPYDIEAAGVSTLNEMYQSGAKFLTAVSSALSGDKTPEQRVEKVKSAGWTLGKTMAEWFGIPATNLENIVTGAVSNMQDLINGELLSYNAGMKDLTLTKGAGYMADALNVGDIAEYTRLMNRLRKQGKTDAQIMTALRKEYRDNDKRVLTAAEALNAGDIDTYEAMADELQSLGFASSTVRDMITVKAAALKKAEEKEDGTETAVPYAAYTQEEALTASIQNGDGSEGLYTTTMLNNLLESGETQAAAKVRKTLIQANGQKKVDSAIQKKFKPLIVEAWENRDAKEYDRLKSILKAVGFTEETISGWVRGTKSSSTSGYRGYSGSYRGYSGGYKGYSSGYKGWNR